MDFRLGLLLGLDVVFGSVLKLRNLVRYNLTVECIVARAGIVHPFSSRIKIQIHKGYLKSLECFHLSLICVGHLVVIEK